MTLVRIYQFTSINCNIFCHFFCRLLLALLKLPYQPKLLPNVQPAKLPTDCRSLQNGNEEVIAIGTGQIEVSKHNPRFILRQVDLTTMPSKKCALKTPELNQRSVIRVDVINGKSIAMGDSGICGICFFCIKTRAFLSANSTFSLKII